MSVTRRSCRWTEVMMKYVSIGVAAMAGLVCGALFTGQLLPSAAQGQDDDAGNLGAQRAAKVDEVYQMSSKVNQKGVAKDPEKVSDERTLFHVPEHFGQILSVTAHGPDAVLWFKSGNSVRNAVVRRAADRLVLVEQIPAEPKETKVR